MKTKSKFNYQRAKNNKPHNLITISMQIQQSQTSTTYTIRCDVQLDLTISSSVNIIIRPYSTILIHYL